MRRAFTLQLDDGRAPPTPLVPDAPPTPGPATPLWRCNGCLMLWGVYGRTNDDGRPVGDGCPLCTPVKRLGLWVANNAAARTIDERAGIIFPNFSYKEMFTDKPILTRAMAIVEQEIVAWPRYSMSCEEFIHKKLGSHLSKVLRSEFEKDGMKMLGPYLTFPQHPKMTVMEVRLGLNHSQATNPETDVIRYRWVQ